MKNLMKYMPLIAAAAIFAVSCSKEETLVPDRADCYDVYFEGGQSGVYEVDMDADPSVTFRVSRSNIRGAITVPLRIETSASGVFAMTTLRFEDGQGTSSFSVRFDNADLQKEYTAKVSINGAEYARTYGLNDTSVEFTVIREDYENYAYGAYYSPLLQSSYSIWEQYLEYSPSLDTYRFSSLFEYGYHLRFKWDGGLNVTMMDESYDTGMSYQDAGGNSLGHITGNPVRATFDPETNMFSFTFDYVVEGYGGFGELTDQYMIMSSM